MSARRKARSALAHLKDASDRIRDPATHGEVLSMVLDFGEKIAQDLRTRIEDALRAAREALSKKDAVAATEKAETLKTVLQALVIDFAVVIEIVPWCFHCDCRRCFDLTIRLGHDRPKDIYRFFEFFQRRRCCTDNKVLQR